MFLPTTPWETLVSFLRDKYLEAKTQDAYQAENDALRLLQQAVIYFSAAGKLEERCKIEHAIRVLTDRKFRG